MSASLSLRLIPFPAAAESPRRKVRCMTARAVRSDNLDHLQRASKLLQQQQHPQQPLQQAVDSPARRRVAPLGLWDRFPTARTVQQMLDTMERFVEDPIFSASEPASVSGALNGYRRGGRTPWEIREEEGKYQMRFDMPGMTRKDVKVWVEEGMLVIRAEKQQQQQEQPAEQADGAAKGEKGEWPASSFGKYNSRIALPESAMVDKIAAEVRDGVLYVTVPKATPTNEVLNIDVN